MSLFPSNQSFIADFPGIDDTAALNVIEIFTEADFGVPMAGVIFPPSGTTYLLMAPILFDGQFDISGIPIFSQISFVSSQKESNTLTSTGSGPDAFFITDGAQSCGLNLVNALIINAGTRPFANLESTSQTSGIVLVKDASIINFVSPSKFTNMIVDFNSSSQWRDSGQMILTDISFRFTNSFLVTNPETGTGETLLDVRSENQSISTILSFINTGLSGSTTEKTFFLHSNLSTTSQALFLLTRYQVFSDGLGEFFGIETDAVTAIADAGGGDILVTATNHNGLDGDTITQSAFSDSNYNGDFIISNVIDGVSYEVTATFGVTETGTWNNKSITQTDPRVTSTDNSQIKIPESMTLSSIRSTKTFVVNGAGVQNTFVLIEDSAAPASGDFIIDTEERISTDNQNGESTFIGVSPRNLEIKYSFDFVHSSGPSQDLEFAVMQNATVITSSILPFNSGITTNISTIGTLLLVEPGDLICLVKNNTTNTNNTDVSNIRRLITSAG